MGETFFTPLERILTRRTLPENVIYGLAVARACAALCISRTSWYHCPDGDDHQDDELIEALNTTV